MAKTRFLPDPGLTLRMTTVMFLLGGLFVALVVALMSLARGNVGLVFLIGLGGIGVAFFQWWSSDTVALRAMRAREVTPQDAPELHGMIDRLCALADMPKPRVAIADTTLPNAFATGRSPERSAVCVTTGILNTLTAEELEGVLAHELSHVAHRDVLVMTVASIRRHRGRACSPAARSSACSAWVAARGATTTTGPAPSGSSSPLVVSLVVYAISFVLMRLLSRYRELCADRSGAYLTQKPSALASALTKISGQMNAIARAGPARRAADERLLHRSGRPRVDLQTLTSTHPPLEQRLDQLAKIAASLGQTL